MKKNCEKNLGALTPEQSDIYITMNT